MSSRCAPALHYKVSGIGRFRLPTIDRARGWQAGYPLGPPAPPPWFAPSALHSLLEFNSLSDGGLMRNLPLALLVFACAPSLLAQGAPPQLAPDQPYSMEYYYKVQWGHQQEFLQLFLKNHY